MTFTPRLLSVLVSLAAFLIVGCGGGDGEVDATPTSTSTRPATATGTVATASPMAETPAPVPAATDTPAPSATPEEPPHAGPIETDPGIDNLGEGVVQPVVPDGGVFNMDPVNAAEDLGIAPPPCAELVFYLTWQVRDPYPPDGVDLELYSTRMGGMELVGSGPSGEANRGCGEIQVRNNSGFEVAVEIRYAIGEIAP